ncbi:granzyme B [Pseudorasbora parva]|uniref:granzyme B n=1 Tax=Pseudorasbora parva TaxID=51549 RepID=UPI00351EA10A
MSILWHITTLLLLRSCTPGFSMNDGIVGGRVSIPHSRPYMVYIRVSESKICDGVLVREDFVITAAHCNASHLMVYLGVDDTTILPDGVAVKRIPHPDFKEGTIGHDIMLLKLKTPAILSKNVKTIALPKTENLKHEIVKNCMVMGWGLQSYYTHGSPSKVLRETNVTLIDSKNCGTNDTLCSEGTTGPALGDSGGPLVCGNVANGIVSFFQPKENHRTSYTDISKYLPWIHHHMN